MTTPYSAEQIRGRGDSRVPQEAEVKRAYLDHARQRVLAIDKSKLNHSAPFKLADLSTFDAVVTEEGLFRIRNGKRVRSKK